MWGVLRSRTPDLIASEHWGQVMERWSSLWGAQQRLWHYPGHSSRKGTRRRCQIANRYERRGSRKKGLKLISGLVRLMRWWGSHLGDRRWSSILS